MCVHRWATTIAAPAERGAAYPERGRPDERIGDDDREWASAQLRGHFTAGRLDVDEFSARLEEVWVAKTGADLRQALRDLPRPVLGPPPAGAHRRRPPMLPLVAVVVGLALLAGARWLVVWLIVAAVVVLVRRAYWRAGFRARAAAPR